MSRRGCWVRVRAGVAAAGVLAVIGCAGVVPSNPLKPSNDRDWSPDLAVVPHARFRGEYVDVYNIRNCSYFSEGVYTLDSYHKTFDLRELDSVDFFVVPFRSAPNLAHTMLSFGFAGRDYLSISVEARFQKGEAYSPLSGVMRQFELMYVIADERDVVRLRTRHRDVDVYRYQAQVEPEKARALLVDMLRRANKLAIEPEFYDTLTNNCTTNIVRHVNAITPNKIPWSPDVLLPGRSDRLAYRLGLLDSSVPFEQLKARARINDLAEQYYDAPDFSRRIRGLAALREESP